MPIVTRDLGYKEITKTKTPIRKRDIKAGKKRQSVRTLKIFLLLVSLRLLDPYNPLAFTFGRICNINVNMDVTDPTDPH